MSDAVDDAFQKIIDRAMIEAAGVSCSPEEYRLQLAAFIDEIRANIRASEATSGISEDD